MVILVAFDVFVGGLDAGFLDCAVDMLGEVIFWFEGSVWEWAFVSPMGITSVNQFLVI